MGNTSLYNKLICRNFAESANNLYISEKSSDKHKNKYRKK